MVRKSHCRKRAPVITTSARSLPAKLVSTHVSRASEAPAMALRVTAVRASVVATRSIPSQMLIFQLAIDDDALR